MDVVVLGLDVEQEEDAGLAQRRLLGGQAAELAEDALRIARRARRVVHDVADGPVGRVGGGLGVAHAGVGAEAGQVPDPEADRRGHLRLLGGVEGHVGEPLVGHEGLGPGVRQDVGHLGPDQVVVDGHQVPAGLQAGEVQLEHLDAVGQERGHHVAGLQVHAPQAVDHLVGPAQQLARGVLGPVRRHQRQVLGILVRQCPKAEIAHLVPSPVSSSRTAVSWPAAVPGRSSGMRSAPTCGATGGRRGAGWRRPGGDARTGSSGRSTAPGRRSACAHGAGWPSGPHGTRG